MKKYELTYDLQFFAEDGGGEESDIADQNEDNEEAEEEYEEEDEPEDEEYEEEDDSEEDDRDYEHDSQMAAARRQGEREAKAKYDAMAAQLCLGKVNPETNKPITNLDEYFEALNAQKRLSFQNEMKSKGIDPAELDRYIANSPEIQHQKQLIAEMQDKEAQAQVKEDIKKIMSLDKSYANESDLMASEEFKRAIEMCQSAPGLNLVDAYKVVNFDSLRNAGVQAAKQAAINQSRGKGHLTASAKTPRGKGSVEIPESDIAKWRRFYPDKSMKELNALYAKVHK